MGERSSERLGRRYSCFRKVCDSPVPLSLISLAATGVHLQPQLSGSLWQLEIRSLTGKSGKGALPHWQLEKANTLLLPAREAEHRNLSAAQVSLLKVQQEPAHGKIFFLREEQA